MKLDDKSVNELQQMVADKNLPISVRNAAAKRFKVLRRSAGRSVQGRLEKHFGHPSPHE